jgi:hypothetical protein
MKEKPELTLLHVEGLSQRDIHVEISTADTKEAHTSSSNSVEVNETI